MEQYQYITSESVTEGHPDKLCDQVADAILDEYLKSDPQSHVAIEVMVSSGMLVIAGEIRSRAKADFDKIARGVIRDIGYVEHNRGFDADTCRIIANVHEQSPDISRGVVKETAGGKKIGGAGDQGIMYGYADGETPGMMPLPIQTAHRLAMQITCVRKVGHADFLYPDGKTQVTFCYDEKGNPRYIRSIVVSAQHSQRISYDLLSSFIKKTVIDPVVDRKWLRDETKIHINPTGRFVIGGPAADTGLTGRKIMVDSYGTVGRHGGGAFSGKDPTKIDRSGAYMARYVAKNIVGAKLASKCEVSLAYVIGSSEPEAVEINTFGTGTIPDTEIRQYVNDVFSFSVEDIIETLQLRKPQYLKTAAYGHFGREDQGFAWEKTDKVWLLKQLASQ